MRLDKDKKKKKVKRFKLRGFKKQICNHRQKFAGRKRLQFGDLGILFHSANLDINQKSLTMEQISEKRKKEIEELSTTLS